MKKLLMKLFWNKIKPNAPCVFVTRYKYKNVWDYQIWLLDWVTDGGSDGSYLGWFTIDGDEWDCYDDLILSNNQVKVLEWR